MGRPAGSIGNPNNGGRGGGRGQLEAGPAPLTRGGVGEAIEAPSTAGVIPRRIIQTGKDRRLSVRRTAVLANMRTLNPEYEYLYFDDEETERFIDRDFPQYRPVFDGFRYRIQKYDFFRYLAVYRYGGFYFDLDVLLARGLDDLRRHGCVFPFEAITTSHLLRDTLGMDLQIGNYAFGATAAHPFLGAVIDGCVRGQRDPGWVRPMMRGTPPLLGDEFFIINSTGPGVVSRTLAERPELARSVTILFPADADVCDVRSWNFFGDWGAHLMESSWRRRRSFVFSKVASYSWRWLQSRRIHASRRRGRERQVGAAAWSTDARRP